MQASALLGAAAGCLAGDMAGREHRRGTRRSGGRESLGPWKTSMATSVRGETWTPPVSLSNRTVLGKAAVLWDG